MAITSIIVPFFNQLQYLEQCLTSALAQTLHDIEVIVVDDGSSEDPSPVIARHNDSRVKVIKQPNAGVAHARNTAISVARGEFLAFLDADDWLAPTMVETLVGVLRQNIDTGLAYCDITRVDANGKTADEHRIAGCRPELSGNILPALIAGGYFPPASVVVRASVVEQVGGFEPQLGGCCDWDLWIRIAAAGYKALFCNERLAFYRLHGQSMSKNQQHMQDAALATLMKNMSSYPRQMAEATNVLIQSSATIWSNNVEAANKIHRLEQIIADLKTYISQLIDGKNWLETQWHSNLEAIKQKEAIIGELLSRLDNDTP
ncbi:glycosyltransferase [Paraburkholderia strydomiana]|uniref:glycosyltransferase n=1 Tax=Paraburkholderia strydomiana TaxID=1245417 RepID=UPI0038BB7952